jgi:hypothetical protein
MKNRTLAAALAVAALFASPCAFAQEDPAPPPDTNPEATKPEEKKQDEKPKPNKDIDETVKDLERIEGRFIPYRGLFSIYRKKQGMTDTLLMEVPADKLDKMYLLQATASTGLTGTRMPIFQGAPLGDIPMMMTLVDDSRIVLLQPTLNFRSPKDVPMQRTIDRGFPATIVASLPIVARQRSRNSYLVEIGAFLRSDIADFTSALGQGPGSYAIDRSFTYLDSLKVFPDNMVARTAFRLNRVGSGPGDRSLLFFVSYNFSELPDTDYRPRIGDIRVGYFQTSYTDLSNNTSYDNNVNYIERWNLQKADPNAALSPPKKPIKFYMDNGIPERFRDAVRAGLLMYNKAFEAIGIKDAIVVEQMPDNADWDIADVRYNIIRWTTGNSFAVALFRADPRTGEILNAAINMDSVFAASGAQEFDTLIDPGPYFPRHEHPGEEPTAMAGSSGVGRPRFGATPSPCNYLADSAQEAQFGLLALDLLEPEGALDKERYVKQRITHIVAHEVGHCLGLRHNFVASTEFAFTQLKDGNLVRQNGVAASVMDYLPTNLAALNQPGTDFFSQSIGTYDRWAIEYGYRAIDARTPEEERPALLQIASQGNLPGHLYQTDGMADAWDPNVSRWDFSRDPLEYVSARMRLTRSLRLTLDQRVPKQGESFYEYTRGFNILLRSYIGATVFATRFVGGMNVSDNFRGDADEKLPLVPVPAAQQRQALGLLNQYVFSEDAFSLPKRNYALLAPNPNRPREASSNARRFPVFDTYSDFQRAVLETIFDPENQNRIVNNEFRAASPADTLSLATLYRSVGGNIWSELTTGKEISALRRNLQRAHLDLLINTVTGRLRDVPRDGVTLAWEQLRSLKGKIMAALPTVKGEYGRPHLEEAKMRIDRALTATTLIN